MRAVREYGAPLVEDPARLAGVTALGVDETAFLAATATRSTTFVTGVVDLTGPPRLLDVLPERSGTALSGWVSAREQRWREAVTVAALDPFRGYATALRTSLPDATLVLDAFQVTWLGFDALDRVRRRVQQDTLGHRGRRDDPLFGIRRLLRRGFDHHSERSWARMLAGLEAGDATGEVGQAWIAAQDLRLLFRARDRADAEQRLFRWLCHCADSNIPELTKLARTIDAWRPELLAYFDTGGRPTTPPKRSTSRSRRSSAPATASATSTTTGSGYCCTAASTGRLHNQHESEAAYHGWWRRATNGAVVLCGPLCGFGRNPTKPERTA